MIQYRRRFVRSALLLILLLVVTNCGSPSDVEPPTAAPPSVTPAPTDTTVPPQDTPTARPTPSHTVPTVSGAAAGIDAYLNERVDDENFSGAVLVARNGQILLSEGYGLADRERNIPNTSQTKFRIGSVTKQFTAMAVLILQNQGKLDVQDRVCEYMSECPADWESITLHHLLTHMSGIPDLTEFPDYGATRATPSPPEQTIARFRDRPLNFAPGTEWRYSNSNYIVLGTIIEQVSGQSYESFLQEQIFGPLQMTSTGYDHNRSDLAVGYKNAQAKADFIHMSIPYAAGGLYSTVEDLYRWDQALYTEQLVPQALLDEMFTPYAGIPGPGDRAYGYGWVIGTEHGRRIQSHAGGIEGFSAVIARYPDDAVTIIVLSNQQSVAVPTIQSTVASQLFGE